MVVFDAFKPGILLFTIMNRLRNDHRQSIGLTNYTEVILVKPSAMHKILKRGTVIIISGPFAMTFILPGRQVTLLQ